ncbi:MAG: 4Fe-4S dicluster domain-containing protein [Planctomycetota bacterium]|jgi:ferredoxin
MSVQEEVRKTAKQLLADGKVDLVIGFVKGALPMRATPVFITEPDAAEQLVWNSYCLNNLAVYLPACFAPDPRLKEQKPPPKVAIIVKGCDGRSTVGLIKELQAESDGTVTIKDEMGKERKFDRTDLLAEACRYCTSRAAPVCDITIGELPQGQEALAPDDRFEEFLKKSTDERWEQFCREISKCILCYACRSACPNCYCKVCFANQTRPNWTGSGNELRDVISYHLGRMFHQAGRCTDCGACVRACPMGIDLRTFTYKLIEDAKESFDYTAGLDLEHAALLMDFGADDSDGFITEPK